MAHCNVAMNSDTVFFKKLSINYYYYSRYNCVTSVLFPGFANSFFDDSPWAR